MPLSKLIAIFSLLILIGCDSKSKQETVNWENAIEHYLRGKQVSIKLPESFKVSSRYRIKEDLPALNDNEARSIVVQKALEKFENSDSEIDLYIDTTSQYRFFVILDSDEKISIDKSAAAKLGRVLMEDYEKMNLSKRGIEVKKLVSTIKQNNIQKMAKFKFEVLNKRKKMKTYVTSFFITNSTRTLIIHEFSDSIEDMEYYTWSINENY